MLDPETAQVHHAPRQRGRCVAAQRLRSRASACGASRCSSNPPAINPRRKPALRRSGRNCSNWAGLRAATCGSTTAGGDASRFHGYADELLALAPERHFGLGHPERSSTAAGELHRAYRLRAVGDPVAMGFVIAWRARRNTTGFTPYDSASPRNDGAARRDRPSRDACRGARDLTIGTRGWTAIQAVAPSFGVELTAVGVRKMSARLSAASPPSRAPRCG